MNSRPDARARCYTRIWRCGRMSRLLLVEDEWKLGATLEEGLERAQYTVDLASDGEEALDFARVSTYDVIVLDVMLPKLSGLEVCQRLRNDGVRTPILMLTARDAVGDRIKGSTVAPT